jgi:hypothetical protein
VDPESVLYKPEDFRRIGNPLAAIGEAAFEGTFVGDDGPNHYALSKLLERPLKPTGAISLTQGVTAPDASLKRL